MTYLHILVTFNVNENSMRNFLVNKKIKK